MSPVRRLVLAAVAMLAMNLAMGCGGRTSDISGHEDAESRRGHLPLVHGKGPPVVLPPGSILAKTARPRRGPGDSSGTVAEVSRAAILHTASSWLGVRYLLGGDDRAGVDCSHFVCQVYHEAKVKTLPYMACRMMRRYPRLVRTDWDQHEGDIVLFPKLDHTGIYFGDGWMIDADPYRGQVTWDDLKAPYWQSFHPYLVEYVP